MDYGIKDYKSEFLEIYTQNIKREGSEKLLDWLKNKSDFFSAPASTRFHSAFSGGLCEHSVKTYFRFIQHLNTEYDGEWDHMGFVTAQASAEANHNGDTYRDYKVAQHTREYNSWTSEDINGWENIKKPGKTTRYGRVRR